MSSSSHFNLVIRTLLLLVIDCTKYSAECTFHPSILHGFRQYHQPRFVHWAPYYVSKSTLFYFRFLILPVSVTVVYVVVIELSTCLYMRRDSSTICREELQRVNQPSRRFFLKYLISAIF